MALKARTYGELEATVADLPSAARTRPRPGGRSRSRHPAVPAARWAVRSVRANPMLLLLMVPALAVTFAMLLAATILWAVLVTVALVLGHRGGGSWTGPGGYRRAQRDGLRAGRRSVRAGHRSVRAARRSWV